MNKHESGGYVDIEDMQAELTWVQASYGDNDAAFEVGFDAASISIDDFDRLRALPKLTDDAKVIESVYKALIGFRLDWNLHKKGVKIPNTAAGIRTAPMSFVMAAFSAIMTAQNPKAKPKAS